MKSLLLVGAAAACLAIGCASSDTGSSFTPATAQVPITAPPAAAAQSLVLGGRLEGGADSLDLDLEEEDGLVTGHAVLSKVPYEVRGLVEADRNCALTMLPYDPATDTDSVELVGSLRAGGTVTLRQSGAGVDLGRVLLTDTPPVASKVWNHNGDGGEEIYDLLFSASTPRPVEYRFRLKFTSGGLFHRNGTFETTSRAGSVRGLWPLRNEQVTANFYVVETTLVRLDLFGFTQGPKGFRNEIGSIYFRTNSNSFFSGGINGESVSLLPDSWLTTQDGNFFADGRATLTLVSGGR